MKNKEIRVYFYNRFTENKSKVVTISRDDLETYARQHTFGIAQEFDIKEVDSETYQITMKPAQDIWRLTDEEILEYMTPDETIQQASYYHGISAYNNKYRGDVTTPLAAAWACQQIRNVNRLDPDDEVCFSDRLIGGIGIKAHGEVIVASADNLCSQLPLRQLPDGKIVRKGKRIFSLGDSWYGLIRTADELEKSRFACPPDLPPEFIIRNFKTEAVVIEKGSEWDTPLVHNLINRFLPYPVELI